MKTISHLTAIMAMLVLPSLCRADDYGWSGSSSRSHSASGYGRSTDYYGGVYGNSMSSNVGNYGGRHGYRGIGYGYQGNGYRNVPTRIGLAPDANRYSDYPAYGTGYGGGYGVGYGTNSGYCPSDRGNYGAGYYGR